MRGSIPGPGAPSRERRGPESGLRPGAYFWKDEGPGVTPTPAPCMPPEAVNAGGGDARGSGPASRARARRRGRARPASRLRAGRSSQAVPEGELSGRHGAGRARGARPGSAAAHRAGWRAARKVPMPGPPGGGARGSLRSLTRRALRGPHGSSDRGDPRSSRAHLPARSQRAQLAQRVPRAKRAPRVPRVSVARRVPRRPRTGLRPLLAGRWARIARLGRSGMGFRARASSREGGRTGLAPKRAEASWPAALVSARRSAGRRSRTRAGRRSRSWPVRTIRTTGSISSRTKPVRAHVTW